MTIYIGRWGGGEIAGFKLCDDSVNRALRRQVHVDARRPQSPEGLGTAVPGEDRRRLVVDDVLSDSRFLACSIHTRSEIVVPLMDGDECIGEIDIDSNRPNNFTPEDRQMLEQVAAIIVERLRQL